MHYTIRIVPAQNTSPFELVRDLDSDDAAKKAVRAEVEMGLRNECSGSVQLSTGLTYVTANEHGKATAGILI